MSNVSDYTSEKKSLQVWHLNADRAEEVFGRDGRLTIVDPLGDLLNDCDAIERWVGNVLGALEKCCYKVVATLKARTLDDAYAATQNVERPWSDEGHRSTSIGDFFYCAEDHTLFVVGPFGFSQVTSGVLKGRALWLADAKREEN
jgi:hypothetical protein